MINIQANAIDLQLESIRQRAKKSNLISAELLSDIEDVFLEPDAFNVASFSKYDLSEIFAYLKESHDYYLSIYLPKIENTLHQLYSKFGNEYIALGILLVFIEKYKTELIQHITYEEQVLFLFVEKMLNGEYCPKNKDFVLNHFLHTHNDNVILHLEELKKDLITFDDDLKDNLVFQILFNQLELFQNDLTIHGLIEDTIFIDKIMDYIVVNYKGRL